MVLRNLFAGRNRDADRETDLWGQPGEGEDTNCQSSTDIYTRVNRWLERKLPYNSRSPAQRCCLSRLEGRGYGGEEAQEGRLFIHSLMVICLVLWQETNTTVKAVILQLRIKSEKIDARKLR